MKKHILLISILISTIYNLSAQRTGTIKGKLIDETSEAIPGAVAELISVKDTTQKKYFSSVFGGILEIPGISYGDYILNISYLGYDRVQKEVKVDRSSVDLGDIKMSLKAEQIGTVVAEGYSMRTSQRGDTVIYNADAFKVTKDADTETLLSKMPGIKVIDGEVEAQGETVKKVFVDGKEFFGQDVNAAIKNLPAEVVSKIEVYNKLSDQAEFTGVDDGEGFKAINIVTTVKSGQFGKMYAGYGIDDKYMVGANVNIFSGDSRIAIMGMANNMNQQNFSMEDILGAVGGGGRGTSSRGGGYMRGGGGNFMVRQQDGISTVQSLGVNYNDKWGKKVEVSGSYFFNNSKNENWKETDRQYYSENETYRAYNSMSNSENRNQEHRFNARLEFKPNKNHSLMWRPSFSFQNYRSESYSEGATNDITGADSVLVNSIVTDSYSKNWGYSVSNTLVYRINLGKPGRTLSTDISGSLSNNDRRGINSTERLNPNLIPPLDSLFRQRTKNYSNNYNLSGNLIYTEPISQYSQVRAEYRVSYRYSDIDRKAYLWLRELEMFNPQFSDEYSSIYNSGYVTHRVGPGYNWSKDRNVITGSVFYQYSTLSNDQDFPTPPRNIKASFDDVVYFAMINKMFNPSTSLRVHARSSTNNPSVSQLSDVVDMSNSLFVTSGNPDLKPSYNHNVFAHFNRSNVSKGTTFMLMGGFSAQSNYIADNTVIQQGNEIIQLPNGEYLENGGQFTQPVNLNGYWSVNSAMSFGIPVSFLKSNLNINLGASYNESPSIINKIRNLQTGQYYNGGLVLGSNISEYIDFTITYNGGYNISSSSMREDNNNEFFSHYLSARFKWVAWAGITFSGNIAYSQYKGITDDYNEEYTQCNLYLGKKVFKNKRGELTFGVNDLFNQKTNFRRNVTDTYIENVKNNTLGRYYGFQFVYNLRSFGKRSSGSSSRGDYDSLDRPSGPPPGGMRMGPPMGGPGPM